MKIERSFEYCILEQSESELDAEGTPFLLVVWEHAEKIATPLQAFGVASKCVPAGDVQEFEDSCTSALMSELAIYQQKSKSEAKTFFDGLVGLNVGPVRTLVNGACVQEDLELVLQKYIPECRVGLADLVEISHLRATALSAPFCPMDIQACSVLRNRF